MQKTLQSATQLLKRLLRGLRIFTSNEELARFYRERNVERALPTRIQWTATFFAIGLLAFLIAFLITATWQRHDRESLLRSHPSYRVINSGEVTFKVLQIPDTHDCDNTQQCYLKNASSSKFQPASFETFMPSTHFGILRFEIPTQIFREYSTDPTDDLILGLPEMHLEESDVFLNGDHNGHQFANYSVAGLIPASYRKSHPDLVVYTVDVSYKAVDPIQNSSFFKNPHSKSSFITTASQYRLLNRILALNDALRRNWLSDLSRVIMAALLLMIFLCVDRSSETLGMALFMGFDALGITLDYGWLPLSNADYAYYFCSFLSGVFKLFFTLQLARIINSRARHWLISSAILGTIYGALVTYAMNSETASLVDMYRDLCINVIGIAVCVRTVASLWHLRLYWRIIALSVAGFACFQQLLFVVDYWAPEFAATESWLAFYFAMRTSSPYLLTLSAFVSISSLENRVRQLTNLEVRTKMVEHELALARAVQLSLAPRADLPGHLEMSFHQHASMHISGDCYSVFWNNNSESMIVILNDVTGHGIHAALKASACQVIAHTIWQNPDGDQFGITAASSLSLYRKKMREFFDSQFSQDQEILSFIGVHLDLRKNTATFYRSNFTFPILISAMQRTAPEDIVTVLNSANEDLTAVPITPGCFIVLASDGFLSGSRATRLLISNLNKRLQTYDVSHLSAEEMKSLLLDSAHQNPTPVSDDDQTLLVIKIKSLFSGLHQDQI